MFLKCTAAQVTYSEKPYVKVFKNKNKEKVFKSTACESGMPFYKYRFT